MSQGSHKDLFGEVWPLDADRLCEWLYVAAEQRHEAHPIDIRELADSIWHFLWEEFAAESPSLADLQDSTVKLARELGHPLLAESLRATAQLNESTVASLEWPPNLMAAHELGIFEIGELLAPLKLAGGWIPYDPRIPCDTNDWQASLEQARGNFSQFAVLTDRQILYDMPTAELARDRLRQALQITGLPLIVNLNWPALADSDDNTVSLFPTWSHVDTVRPSAGPLDLAIGDNWHKKEIDRIKWRWHVRSSDLRNVARHQLRMVCTTAMSGIRWQFVLDRRHQSLNGTFGLFQDDPAILQFVTVHMDAFVRHLQSRISSRQELLDRLGSLARLILEVGHTRVRNIRQCRSASTRKRIYTERSIMVVQVSGMATWDQELALQLQTRLARELDRDDQGIAVRMTQDVDANGIIDLRTPHGVDQILSDRRRNVDPVQVRIDKDHLLAAERILQLLNTLFRNSQISEIEMECASQRPS